VHDANDANDANDATDAAGAAHRPPLAVLISGAPGSGKSTLAEALGVGLDLPVLHKDQLVHGIWRTRARAMELGAAGVEPFYKTMEAWLAAGVSFVAEQTFYRGFSEPDVARRLAPKSVLVHVHCRSAHA
jgi:predicted ABC-type ATPase